MLKNHCQNKSQTKVIYQMKRKIVKKFQNNYILDTANSRHRKTKKQTK